jgi:hypothetical protein
MYLTYLSTKKKKPGKIHWIHISRILMCGWHLGEQECQMQNACLHPNYKHSPFISSFSSCFLLQGKETILSLLDSCSNTDACTVATTTVPPKEFWSVTLGHYRCKCDNWERGEFSSKKDDSIGKLTKSHTSFQWGETRALIFQLLVFQTTSEGKHLNMNKYWYHLLSASLYF